MTDVMLPPRPGGASTLPRVPRPMVLDVYDAALHRAGAGGPAVLVLRDDRGDEHRVDTAAWCRPELPGDARLIADCDGPTLDVGCGPGRLTGALNLRGVPALGIDVSAAAVRLARRRGATALRRDVFGPLPGHGRWRHLLLADGNIGIGGDPVGLLRRCRELIDPGGRVLVEVASPGSRSWSGAASLHDGTAPGARFRWAVLAADDLPATAERAALRVLHTRTEAGRWFSTLTTG